MLYRAFADTHGRIVRRGVLAITVVMSFCISATAQEVSNARKGTGLSVPRFVSLKTDRVNLREGPSKDNRTTWVFQRAGLPVEIIAEYDNWRRIRDSEGAEGWVWHSLLSGRRTALIMPWNREKRELLTLYSNTKASPGIIARLEPNVIVSVRECDTHWCEVSVSGEDHGSLRGFVPQDKLWGVYPNETLE